MAHVSAVKNALFHVLTESSGTLKRRHQTGKPSNDIKCGFAIPNETLVIGLE